MFFTRIEDRDHEDEACITVQIKFTKNSLIYNVLFEIKMDSMPLILEGPATE